MHYVKLGSTGLEVSPIAVGCLGFGRPDRGLPVWSLTEEASRPLIKQAVEVGINFFDTANVYSLGSSEEIVGRALKDFANRDEIVISTKVRQIVRSEPNGSGLSRKAIFTEVDHSLRRLGVDYIDLYQIHRHDPATPMEETLEALHDVVKAGKVRYLGASSMKAWEFAKALYLQREHGWARYATMQDHYNLLAREEEREMLPLCLDAGVGLIPWSPLARGRLTHALGDQGTDREVADRDYANRLYPEVLSDQAIITAVGRVAVEHGVSMAQIALAWLRSKPVVSAPIVGITEPAHLADAVASLDVELSNEQIAQLEGPYTPRADLQASQPATPTRSASPS